MIPYQEGSHGGFAWENHILWRRGSASSGVLRKVIRTARPPRGATRAPRRSDHREGQITGTFGTETVRVPRARIVGDAGKATEWRSKALPRYQRLTKSEEDQKTAWDAVFPTNEALIAAVTLSGTNPRRVKRALFGLFEGVLSKDVVSRARAARSRWTGTRRSCPQSGRCGYRPVRPLSRTDRVRGFTPGRHRDQDPAGTQGHQHLGSGRYRPVPRRAEAAVIHQEYGRGEHRSLAPVPR